MKSMKRPRVPMPLLACIPQRSVVKIDLWWIHELRLKPDGSLDWYLRGEEGLKNHGPISYEKFEEAIAETATTNALLISNIDALGLSDVEKESLRLKVEKAVTAEERLLREELMMLAQAKNKFASARRPEIHELVMTKETEHLRSDLHKILLEMPYLTIVHLYRHHSVVGLDGEGKWSRLFDSQSKVVKYCYREMIARAFGYSGTDHWGKTKAAIRAELLPRANQLLHEASVKMILADALRQGKKVIVFGGFVFWYEEDGQVGWVIKQAVDSETEGRGNTLWKEGTIVSTNHGRIVVLPYIKENGERVRGHTKNAPHDGKALPRHPDNFVELPFEVLQGDEMYDLMGRIVYE